MEKQNDLVLFTQVVLVIKGWRVNPFRLNHFAYPKWHTQKKYIHMKEEENIYKIRRNNAEQLYQEKIDEEEII